MHIPSLNTTFRFAIAFGLLASCSAIALRAQSGASPSTSPFGITASGSYAGYDIDTVNMDNGNVIVRTPLFSLPQLGKLALSFSAVSNTTSWQQEYDCPDGVDCEYYYSPSSPFPRPTYSSINISSPVIGNDQFPSAGYNVVNSNYCTLSCQNYQYIEWSVLDASGGSHQLFYDSTNMSRLRSTDGSGYLFYTGVPDPYNYNEIPDHLGTKTLIDSRGIRTVWGGQSATTQSDPDNNSIAYTPPTPTPTPGYYKDSMQRTIPDVPEPTSSIQGCPNLNAPYQPVVGSSTWTVPGPNNANVTYLICFTDVHVHTNFFGYNGQNYRTEVGVNSYVTYEESVGDAWAIQSIVLPDQVHYWGYVYDAANPADSTSIAYGSLVTLLFPQGGSISYQYRLSPRCYTDSLGDIQAIALSERVVKDVKGNVFPWKYSINQTGTGNVVTDPDGNDTVYTYINPWSNIPSCSDFEDTRTVYQGSHTAASPVVLKVTQSGYTTVEAPLSFATDDFPGVGNALRTSETTTLTGSVSTTLSTGYDTTNFSATAPSCQVQMQATCSIARQQYVPLSLAIPTSTSVTDYKTNAVLKSTATQYKWQDSGSPYFAGNILDTPYTQKTYDGQNNLVAQTTFSYDDPSYLLCPPSNQGHPTTTLRWNNMGPSVQTNTAWTCTGMIDHTMDGNNYTTSYAYDDTGIFPKTVTAPATNGVQHIDHYTWDPNSGHMLSHTDQNGIVTNYSYDDPLGRVTTIKRAAGVVDSESDTSYSYPSATEVDASSDLNSTGDGLLKSKEFYDGLGRVVEEIGSNGAETDTAYNGEGLIASVSNPYFSTSDPTYGFTSFAYDALGRKTFQCQPDNGTGSGPCVPKASFQQWSYNGNTTTSTDEVGHQRQQVSDALGDLTKVYEPDANNKPTIETDYYYDALNNLTQINQQGLNRNFTYDSLSRLITSFNPESGLICYGTWDGGSVGLGKCVNGYDGNGNIRAKTDARGVVTTYGYDALDRLISKTYYNDPSRTPWSCYQYDQSSVSGSGGNLIGRPTNQWTQGATAGACPAAPPASGVLTQHSILAYDEMGHALREQQCHLSTCTTVAPYSSTSDFNLAGEPTSYTSGIHAIGFAYHYDPNGRLQALYSSWSDPTHPSLLFSVGQFTSTNAIQNMMLGPNINVTRSYDNRLRVTSETASHP